MHLCCLNKEFLGLAYDFYQPLTSNYGLMTFKLYHCKKCGRLFHEDKMTLINYSKSLFDENVKNVRTVGYKPIGEFVNPKISNEY